MGGLVLNTANQTFRQLMGNGLTYRVPRFQRDYSWNADEWDDLWQDIQAVLEPDGDPAHYMGYLVLQTQDQKNFDVIDGQQRLTTLSLMVLAVLNTIQDLINAGQETEDNRRRSEQLRNTYIGYLDPVTLIAKTKLKLNRNNDAYYQDYLVPILKLPEGRRNASERLLRKAFEWHLKKVREEYGPPRGGRDLARFLDSLADRLLFTVITVTDELNAFKVFETLNARGVRLSPTDLLKNYLFSVIHRGSEHSHELDAMERRWEGLVGRLGEAGFPAFLRVHWNSRRKFVREAELFKTIRSQTPDKESVFRLMREMEEDVEVFAALSDPEDGLWLEEQRKFVRELRLFGVRQPWSLLVAAYRVFGPSGMTDILRACAVISFRYNVIGGLAAHEQERTYGAVAFKIATGELTEARQAIRDLAPVYVSDARFREAFADKVLRTTRNRKMAKYILFSLERQLTRTDYDASSAKYTLEHILPENPDQGWTQFTDGQLDEFTYRLGNFTLMAATPNRNAGNADFAAKKEMYAASEFEITRRVAEENEDWTPDRVAERQRQMAKQATAIWGLAQLAG